MPQSRSTKQEAAWLEILRIVCEQIGYGRAIQVAEEWFEEQCPGVTAARHEVIANDLIRHRPDLCE